MQDLFQALQMFQSGVKDLAFSSALSQANEQVQQIKAQVTNEQEQRAALHQVSQGLVARMAGLGVPATTIAQVAGAVGPSVDPLTAQENALKRQDQMRSEDKAFEAGQNALNRQHQFTLKLLDQQIAKQAVKGETKQADIDFKTNVESAFAGAQRLREAVKNTGNFEVSDPKAKVTLDQAAYDLAIAYAKIVDPTSVAREGEVDAAKKYMLPMGFGTRNSVTLEAIKQYEQKIIDRVKARGQAREGADQPNTLRALGAEASAPAQGAGGTGGSKYFKPIR
jgi:hypothetical protein